MKSIKSNYEKIQKKNPNLGDLINLANALKDKKFSRRAISENLEKLVDPEDYDNNDKIYIVDFLENLSNPLRTTKNGSKMAKIEKNLKKQE